MREYAKRGFDSQLLPLENLLSEIKVLEYAEGEERYNNAKDLGDIIPESEDNIILLEYIGQNAHFWEITYYT